MVNLPDYNPNRRNRDAGDALRNRSVTDLIEPGSTIKPFTVAMALQSGEFTADSIVDTSPGAYRVGGHTIHDVHDYGALTVSRVIVKSSNIGAAKIAMTLSPLRLYETLHEVGFGSATGIELPGERSGSLPNRRKWRPIEHATLSYGYGMAATPLQIAQAYAVLANDGLMVPVTIRKRVGEVRGERVLSGSVVRDVTNMLEEVVSREGTARRARVPLFRTAGKTGTSHKLIDGRYAENRYVSSFAGFAPASDPRFVMVVVVDDPRSDRYFGGFVAAPVFAEVMAEVLRLYNVAPDDLEAGGLQVVARAGGENE
jgi:cell division protein FtsI (penicillin-binding protein 3)